MRPGGAGAFAVVLSGGSHLTGGNYNDGDVSSVLIHGRRRSLLTVYFFCGDKTRRVLPDRTLEDSVWFSMSNNVLAYGPLHRNVKRSVMNDRGNQNVVLTSWCDSLKHPCRLKNWDGHAGFS
jgi:hypothetical protein